MMMGGLGEGETGRLGEGETGRRRKPLRLSVSPSLRLPVSPSPRLPVSQSPRLPVSPNLIPQRKDFCLKLIDQWKAVSVTFSLCRALFVPMTEAQFCDRA